MALLSFNSSESAPRIAAVPREIIYVPPPGSRSPESNSRFETADARALLHSGSHATASTAADSQAHGTPEHPFGAGTFDLAQTERASSGFDGSPAVSFTAQNPADRPMFAANTAAADEAAFSGVFAPVPEPSAWAMMLSGAGVLLATLRRRQRR
jgi:hypothetical protein